MQFWKAALFALKIEGFFVFEIFVNEGHNGERVSNKILVFFVIPYKIEINLSPYPWKNCSEASKHVNFQLQKFTISITLPKISIFLQHLHFHFFKNVT